MPSEQPRAANEQHVFGREPLAEQSHATRVAPASPDSE